MCIKYVAWGLAHRSVRLSPTLWLHTASWVCQALEHFQLLHTLFSLLGGQLLVILEGPLTLSTSSRIPTNIGFSKKLGKALPCDPPPSLSRNASH